eukprot:scaffold3264_cov20-Prasinocladus_malaysianus.AAC.3
MGLKQSHNVSFCARDQSFVLGNDEQWTTGSKGGGLLSLVTYQIIIESAPFAERSNILQHITKHVTIYRCCI